jgi:hypothetical protein
MGGHVVRMGRLLVGQRPLGRPRRRWVDNADLREIGLDLSGSGCVRLKLSCECGDEPFGFHKMLGSSWVAAQLVASARYDTFTLNIMADCSS